MRTSFLPEPILTIVPEIEMTSAISAHVAQSPSASLNVTLPVSPVDVRLVKTLRSARTGHGQWDSALP